MRILVLSAFAAAALCGTASVHAAVEGFYVGLGGGQSSYDDNLGAQIRRAYAGRSDYAVEAAGLTDRDDQAWKATLGYRFLPWLSAELAWTDAGEAASAFRLRSIAPLTSGTADLHGRYELGGASLALVGEWPVSERFALSLRAGVVRTRLDYSERGTDALGRAYAFDGPTDSDSGGLAGLGLAWRLAPRWDLRLDWDRWFGVGTRFDVGTDTNGKFDHVDFYTANVFYRFGE